MITKAAIEAIERIGKEEGLQGRPLKRYIRRRVYRIIKKEVKRGYNKT